MNPGVCALRSSINAEPGYSRLQARVQEIASSLLDQLTIPAIRAQRERLEDLARRSRSPCWRACTDEFVARSS
jgi:hypothetical protein